MRDDHSRREFWQAHWQRCRELGMTLKAYAEQEGLTVSVFYGWSKRFKRESAGGSAFTRVVVSTSPTHYRLRFPNGLVLEWSGEADGEQLARLAKRLG